MSLQEIQNTSAPDGAASGTVPVAVGAEATSTGAETVTPAPTKLEHEGGRQNSKKKGATATAPQSAAGDSANDTDAANSPQLEASCELASVQEFSSRIAGISYEAPAFKTAEEFKAAFQTAEAGAHGAAQKKFDAEAELILYLAMVQSFLSERGANAHLRKQAGIKAGFEEWYEAFREKYDVEYAFKTIQHKIAQLRGGCEHCGRLNEDHKKSCPRFQKIDLIEAAAKDAEENGKPGNGRSGKLDVRELRDAFYADRYMAMVGLLTNAPRDASPQQIFETMQQEAVSAYEDLDAESAQKIRVPKLVKPQQSEIEKAAIKLARRIVQKNAVLTVADLRDEATQILAIAGIAVMPEDIAPGDGQKKTERDARGSTRRLQIAPIPQKPPDHVPLQPGRKYTVRPHAQGGWGVYEPGSTVCWQRHPSQDSAWDAIEAATAGPPSEPQPSNAASEVSRA